MLRCIKIATFSVLLLCIKIANSAPLNLVSNTSMPKPLLLASVEKTTNAAQRFLNENQKKPEILTLPSGLQYKIVQEGQGKPPQPTDFVTVNYRGTLIDGTEFDSSYSHSEPATFAVNAVIPGWSEALQMMKPGAKWTIYLPPALAYGSQGAGRLIKPNSTLIFDIELINVKPPLEELEEEYSIFDDED